MDDVIKLLREAKKYLKDWKQESYIPEKNITYATNTIKKIKRRVHRALAILEKQPDEDLDMLETIMAIRATNTYTDGSHESKNIVMDDLITNLHNRWVILQAENTKLKAEMDKWNLSAKNIERDLSFEEENKRLKENNEALWEYARHGEGCPHQYDKKYHCKCGWLKVQQELKGE